MKGKYANAAERRRYLEGLERRASEAEAQVGQLTAKLAGLQEKTDRQLASFAQEVRDLRRQRDENASPLLAGAEDRIRALMSEVEGEKKKAQETLRRQHAQADGVFRLLGLLGFSRVESGEILMACLGNAYTYVVDEDLGSSRKSKLSTSAVVQIQAAKGNRSNPELVKEIRRALAADAALPVDRPAQQGDADGS